MPSSQASPSMPPQVSLAQEKLRVYFPVESLAGLGHFNRAGLLVEALHAAGMEVTVGSGTFVDEQRFFPNARRISLPTYVHRTQDGKFTAWDEAGQKRLVTNFDMNKWKQERSQAHRDIVRDVKPHIIIVEFWPFSRRNLTHEVSAMYAEASKHTARPMLITSVCDVVKGDVDQMKGGKIANQEKNDQSAVEKLQKVDAIIIHGDERLVGLDKSFTGLHHITDKTYYSGYVVADIPQRDSTRADQDRPVLLHVGSGSNGTDFLMSAAKAWQNASPDLKAHTWHFVTGPRFPDGGWESLARILAEQGTTHVTEGNTPYRVSPEGIRPDFVLEKYRPDLVDLIANSAVSVSYAGYNTTQEVLASGVRALLVPKLKRQEQEGTVWFDAEQSHRLDVLNKAGLVHTLAAKEALNPLKLAQAIHHAYKTPAASHAPVDFDGARQTADLIGKLYDLHHRRPKHNRKTQRDKKSREVVVREVSLGTNKRPPSKPKRHIILKIEI